MDTGLVAFKSWLDAYGLAWENRNPETAAALFNESVPTKLHPFSNPCAEEKPFSSIGRRWPEPKRILDSDTRSWL
jgi:hypothetical protein